MKALVFVAASGLALAIAWSLPAFAQVTDAERAAARELFKEGDELQRAGKFTDALDKFQRAQRAYSAPTNELHIAECQVALGQLVEAAESYRATLRMPLPPGSPPAFQAAVDQAKTELAQVEPRVPKLVVQVSPASSNPQMQIDGQTVSAALIGAPIPLDPGTHRVRIFAAGFTSSDQDAGLKERETTTLVATLKPTGEAAPPAPALPPPPPPMASTATPGTPPMYVPPPPPPISDKELLGVPAPSRTGVIVGGHLGYELAAGSFPFDARTKVEAGTVAAGGVAFGGEGGLRFARHWYAGLALEHAELGHGDLSNSGGATDGSSSTTLLAVIFGFIANPDRASFYGEIGGGTRWFSLSETIGNVQRNASYNAFELTLGGGLWLPVGHAVRLLPEMTVGLGSFDVPTAVSTTSASQGHGFITLSLAGFYNLDL